VTADPAQHEHLVAADLLAHPDAAREEGGAELDRDRNRLGEHVLLGLDTQAPEAAREHQRVDSAEARVLECGGGADGVGAARDGAEHLDALLEMGVWVRVARS
jgi:hypothetical protein